MKTARTSFFALVSVTLLLDSMFVVVQGFAPTTPASLPRTRPIIHRRQTVISYNPWPVLQQKTSRFGANDSPKEPTTTTLRSKEDDSGDSCSMRVGICGAGAIALAMAAMLSQAGHVPMVWSPSSSSLSSSSSTPTTNRVVLKATGAIRSNHDVTMAVSCQDLLEHNTVIIIAIPTNGHKTVMDAMVPFIDSKRHVIIISSHASMGALYLAQQMLQLADQSNNNNNEDDHKCLKVPITAWGTTVCTARKLEDDDDDDTASNVLLLLRVKVNTIRSAVDMCTIPQGREASQLDLCRTLFPQVAKFVPRFGLLAISLSNLNPQHHLGIALCNMSRMERGEIWYQFFQGVTPKVGRFLEQLDAERLSLCRAMNDHEHEHDHNDNSYSSDTNKNHIVTKDIFQHFSQSFGVPVQDTIYDMMQEIYRQGKDVYGPTTANSRYVLEDVPYGLALIVLLGQMCGKPAILHQAGMRIMSAMYVDGNNDDDDDFMTSNDLLSALNLSQYSLQELKQASLTGVLPTTLSSSSSLLLNQDTTQTQGKDAADMVPLDQPLSTVCETTE